MKNVPGRKASATSTRKPVARKPAARKPERVEFQPLLLAALKEQGVTVKVRPAPKGNYSSLLLDGVNIAYLDKQTSKGMKVIAAAEPGELKNGFQPSGRSGRFGAQLLVTKEAEVVKAAAGIKLAAEKARELSKAEKAKPAPKPKLKPEAAASKEEVAS